MSEQDDRDRAEERADASDSIQEQLATAIASLDATMQALVAQLDIVGDSNEEIKSWRIAATKAMQRSTWALRGLVIAVVLLAAVFSGVGWVIYKDGVRRDEAAADEAARQAVQTEEDRQSACRSRNTGQHETRLLFLDVFDQIEGIGVDPADVDVLRGTVGGAKEKDRDCNQDGMLDDLDYAEPIETD